VIDLETLFPAKDRFELAMTAQQPAGLARLRRLDGGRAARHAAAALHARRKAAAVDPVDRPPERRRADVLRHDPAQRGRRLDAGSQSGTSSLRAILYMDEVFGYFPPVANPPSKRRC
jgi:hypothetical protein